MEAAAKQALDALRRRRAAFPELKDDAEWAIVLDLLASGGGGRPVSVGDACSASGAAGSTALRRIERLEDAGVLVRSPDPHDRRRWFVRLSKRAEQRLTAYLSTHR